MTFKWSRRLNSKTQLVVKKNSCHFCLEHFFCLTCNFQVIQPYCDWNMVHKSISYWKVPNMPILYSFSKILLRHLSDVYQGLNAMNASFADYEIVYANLLLQCTDLQTDLNYMKMHFHIRKNTPKLNFFWTNIIISQKKCCWNDTNM